MSREKKQQRAFITTLCVVVLMSLGITYRVAADDGYQPPNTLNWALHMLREIHGERALGGRSYCKVH